MTNLTSTCEREWKQLGVPSRERDQLNAELQADLDAAQQDGMSVSEFVGGDVASFAREWAQARGLVRVPWRLAGTFVAALLPPLVYFTLLNSFYRIPDGHTFGRPGPVGQAWWAGMALGLGPLFLASCGAIGGYLLWRRDPETRWTTVAALASWPVSCGGAALITRRAYFAASYPPEWQAGLPDWQTGVPDWLVYSLILAALLTLTRCLVVVAVRLRVSRRSAG